MLCHKVHAIAAYPVSPALERISFGEGHILVLDDCDSLLVMVCEILVLIVIFWCRANPSVAEMNLYG